MIEVLGSIGEEDPEHLGETPGAREHRFGLGPGERSAEADREGTELGVATDPGTLDPEVRHARTPLLDRDVPNVRTVTDHDLDDRIGERPGQIR